jgi:glycosyltransferase involved in cell wall biosynthesis
MKIGIISNLYPPYIRGGAEHVVVRTVESLNDRGHDVFVVTSMPKMKGKDIVLNTNAVERIYQFNPKNLYFVLNDHLHSWPIRLIWHVIDALAGQVVSRLNVILDEEQPDVVMTHNLKGIGLRLAHAVQKRKIPHIHIVHDLQLIIPSGLKFAGKEKVPFFTKPFYSIYQFITKKLLGSPDVVIFPSAYLKKEYTKHGFFKDSKIVVLPNPAPKFSVTNHRNRISGPLNLLFLGQLEEHKGISFLLDYFSSGETQDNLIIAGEGSLVKKANLIAEEHKNITYLGYIAIDQLLNCFEVVDASIVPSLCYENSPTVIYESLQAGVPVIASNIGGVGELLENGKNGYLFDPGNKDDMHRALQKLRESRHFFAQSRDKIRKTVENYSLEKYTDSLEDLIKDLIKK